MTAAALYIPEDADTARALVTPEGITLTLHLATAGQRASAFLLDLAIMVAVLVGFTLAVVLIFAGLGITGYFNGITGQLLAVVWLLGFFILRNLWFILFESGRRGATPGKRALGIRVASRDGGRLSTDAVVARNLLRELEVFLPLSFLGYQAGNGEGDGWTALAGLAWAFVFTLLPLFNRDRLRAGDLIAGTWVLRTPRRVLGADVATRDNSATAFQFSDEQLDAYGVYELQTLETVLRRSAGKAMRRAADDPVVLVAASIRRKIGQPPGGDDHEFLAAYYAALRARLERGLAFGRRRADKSDR